MSTDDGGSTGETETEIDHIDETESELTDERTSETTPDDVDLAAQVELLTEENRRLRSEYARARRAQYRGMAAGLLAVGLLAVGGGVLFTDGREVLFALGAVGLFGAVLTYYVMPGQFVAANVGERIYASFAANGEALADELGLRADRVYVPGSDGETTGSTRLFVPQQAAFDLPDDLTTPIVTEEPSRGLVLEPSGAGLFEEFERVLTGPLSSEPTALATQLVDGLVEQFELVESADPDVDPDDGRLTVAVDASAFGAVDRFDHPVGSFLAVGCAQGLERPVELEVESGDDRADWLVTCRWDRPHSST